MSEYSPQEQAAYDFGFKIGKSTCNEQLAAVVEALTTVWKALDNPKFDSWDAKELRKPLGLLLAKYRNDAALAKIGKL